jgi:phage terminase large subunit-like protein
MMMKKKIHITMCDLTESNISYKQNWYTFEACLSHRKGRKRSGDAHDAERPTEIFSNGIHQEQPTNAFLNLLLGQLRVLSSILWSFSTNSNS